MAFCLSSLCYYMWKQRVYILKTVHSNSARITPCVPRVQIRHVSTHSKPGECVINGTSGRRRTPINESARWLRSPLWKPVTSKLDIFTCIYLGGTLCDVTWRHVTWPKAPGGGRSWIFVILGVTSDMEDRILVFLGHLQIWDLRKFWDFRAHDQ